MSRNTVTIGGAFARQLGDRRWRATWRATWRAFPVAIIIALLPFPTSAGLCGKSMDAAYKNAKQYYDQEKKNLRLQPVKFKKAFKAALKKRHKIVVRHEYKHIHAAGRWAKRKPYLYYIKYRGIKYAIAGCAFYKSGIPLNVDIRGSLAPEEPSLGDYESALKACLKMKKSNPRTRNIPVQCRNTKQLYREYILSCKKYGEKCLSYKEIRRMA